jgi:hypothetical protein
MSSAKKGDMKLTRTIAMLFTALILIALPGHHALGDQITRRLPDTSQAQSYTILDQQDFSAGYGRVRKTACIASDAESFTARAHTAIRASIDLQRNTGADYVQVAVTPITGIGCSEYYSAIAEYAPDGGGVTGDQKNHFWQVKASDIFLDIEERLLLKAWHEAAPEFTGNGTVDMEGMKQYLSRQLNLTVEKVEHFRLRGVEMVFTLRPYRMDGIGTE